MKTKITSLFYLLPLFYLTTISTIAQDTTSKEWNYLVQPYVLFAAMDGTTGIGNLPDMNVDASASDIFGNLHMGGMLYAEAYTDKWSVCSDIIYMNLKQGVTSGPVIESGYLQAKQFAWEVSALRKLLPWLDAGVGARLNVLEASGDLMVNNIEGSSSKSRSTTETWVDPIIILRTRNNIGEKFEYEVRGDIGGFGIGSHFAWQVQAYVDYKFSKLFQLGVGYRVISMDYSKGSGDNRFEYDVKTSGPVIQFGFNL